MMRGARLIAALLVAAAGAIHLYLYFDFFHRVRVIGALFVANFVAGLLIAVALAVRSGAATALAGFAFSVGTFVAFLISTQWSLFGYRERFWGSWQEAAGGVELAAALLLLAVLVRVERPAPMRPRA
jgi:hypothetical protein